MPTPYAQALVSWSGEKVSTQLHREAVSVITAATITGVNVSAISVYQPWTHSDVVRAIEDHPLAISNSLIIKVVPGMGLFGRAVMLHTAWGNEGEPAPVTVSKMSQLHGYKVHTYGGAADPGEADSTMSAPYNEARSDVLKARTFPIGGKIVLYYFFTEANFGTTQVAGERFIFHIVHEYELYGRN